MHLLKEYSNMVVASFTSIFIWLLGGLDVALQVLIFLVIADYVTGVMVGYVNQNLSSKESYRGILKKVGTIVCVMVAVMGDKLLGTDNTLRLAIILCFCGNEGISILENVANLGVPIPQKLVDALLQLKGGRDAKDLSKKSKN